MQISYYFSTRTRALLGENCWWPLYAGLQVAPPSLSLSSVTVKTPLRDKWPNPKGEKHSFHIIFFSICLGVGSRQYCRYSTSAKVFTLLKEIWESPRVNENLTSVGFEPTTSGLDLPMFYRLSYEASTEAGRGNLDSESR